MRPVIGITADFDPPERAKDGESVHFVHDDLVRAVVRAGGAPFIVPCVGEEAHLARVLEEVDGLIFSGSGSDLDPHHYGEEPHPALGPSNPARLDAELGLARRALASTLPVLGICGGLQTLNVAAGGSLYQDLSSQLSGAIPHKPGGPSSRRVHLVRLQAGSRLEAIVGRSLLEVNSTHHQAVKAVGEPFAVVAEAPDGVVEAVEAPGGRFLVGLQWHPEYLADQCRASRAIFEALVAAARAHAGA